MYSLYIFISWMLVASVIYKMYKEDVKKDSDLDIVMDGYNFRTDGRKYGNFSITFMAFLRIFAMLPYVNIIVLVWWFYTKSRK